MSDDPTRIMRDDDDGYRGNGHEPIGPEDQQRHLRYLIIGLLAVIAGLIVAVIIISGSGSSDSEQTGTTDTPSVTDTTPEIVPVTPTGGRPAIRPPPIRTAAGSPLSPSPTPVPPPIPAARLPTTPAASVPSPAAAPATRAGESVRERSFPRFPPGTDRIV